MTYDVWEDGKHVAVVQKPTKKAALAYAKKIQFGRGGPYKVVRVKSIKKSIINLIK